MGRLSQAQAAGPFLDTAGCAVGGAGVPSPRRAPAPRLWSGGTPSQCSEWPPASLPSAPHPCPSSLPSGSGPPLSLLVAPLLARCWGTSGAQWSTSLSLQAPTGQEAQRHVEPGPSGPRLPVCERGARVAVTLGPQEGCGRASGRAPGGAWAAPARPGPSCCSAGRPRSSASGPGP